jgi:hypothetical protein
MDSKKRTKILYEDPNSIFKAGKKIYLHELQGSTLRSQKPFPNDINAGLKTSNLVVTLISKLTTINSILDYIYSTVVANEIPITPAALIPSLKDGNTLSVSIKSHIKDLLKMPQSTFKEDDVFSINSLYISIKETLQQIDEIGANVPMENLNDLYTSRIFVSFFDNMLKVLKQLEQLIPYMSGISSVSVSLPNVVDEIPEPEPVPVLDGAGRFNVLSKRMQKIQIQPFKRFL